MRGIDNTKTERIYESDCKLLKKAMAKNKIRYFADGFRMLISENIRLRKRNAYLEYDTASMLRKIRELERTLKNARS